MSLPPPPTYPAYPNYPAYPSTHMPYYNGINNDSSLMNFIQDSTINQNLTEAARNITHDIGQTDRNLTQSIHGVNSNISNGISAVKDTVYVGNLGVRDLVSSTSNSTQDSVQRNGLATNSTLTSMEQASAERGRDILQAIERTSGEARYTGAILSGADRQANNDLARDIINQSNRNTNEIVSGVSAGGVATNLGIAAVNVANSERTRDIIQAIEKNASESRYTTAVTGAADRQTMGDLARDGILNYNRGTSDIMNSITSNGVAGLLATTNNSFEIKSLINQGNSALLSSSAAQYSSVLLENQKSLFETYKMKEVLAAQMADAKYEALKNKEALAAQMAECCCETKMEALKNTERLSAQLAASSCEAKYEALKNTQMISTQLSECCCEIKEKIGCVYNKLDDTVRILDGNRVRDALTNANNEINLLKAIDYSRRRDRSPGR